MRGDALWSRQQLQSPSLHNWLGRARLIASLQNPADIKEPCPVVQARAGRGAGAAAAGGGKGKGGGGGAKGARKPPPSRLASTAAKMALVGRGRFCGGAGEI